MCAVVAVKSSLFAGHVLVDFRSVTRVWKKTCGDCPAAGLTGSVLTAASSMDLAINEEIRTGVTGCLNARPTAAICI